MYVQAVSLILIESKWYEVIWIHHKGYLSHSSLFTWFMKIITLHRCSDVNITYDMLSDLDCSRIWSIVGVGGSFMFKASIIYRETVAKRLCKYSTVWDKRDRSNNLAGADHGRCMISLLNSQKVHIQTFFTVHELFWHRRNSCKVCYFAPANP